MSVIEEIKAHADKMELAAVNFRDAKGNFAKGKQNIAMVELIFIDQQKFTCTAKEFEHFDTYEFRLAPKRLDS